MRLAGLVLRELWHRKVGAALSIAAVAAAVALANVFVLLARAGEAETRILQRDIGLNVLVLPAATDLDRYWSLGYSEHSMPASHVELLEDQDVANRLIPLLKRRLPWRGMDVLLVGIAGEVFRGGERKKAVFGRELASGTLVVGGEVAARLALSAGDSVDLLGEPFTVETVLATGGSEEDVSVYASLADAQRVLDLEGRINEIQALECHCGADVVDPLARLRETLEPLLPGTRVVRKASLADARRQQRLLAEGTLRVTTPIVLVLCGLVVALLAAMNVRERRAELGVLRALGYGSGAVAGVFLGRALVVGVLGAGLGAALGTWTALRVGPELFHVARAAVQPDATLTLQGLALAPLFACIACLAPTLRAVVADPAEVLRGE